MIKIRRNLSSDMPCVYICQNWEELRYVKERVVSFWSILQDWVKQNQDSRSVSFYYIPTENIYVVYIPRLKSNEDSHDYTFCREYENVRKCGGQICQSIQKHRFDSVSFYNLTENSEFLYTIIEGVSLAHYSFDKYKTSGSSSRKKNVLKEIQVLKEQVQSFRVDHINATTSAVHFARDLVNEPPNVLTAEELSHRIKVMAKESRIRCQIYDKGKIENLKMGGLLAVNRGSLQPPTFTILEHQPASPVNKQPIVLVGKGVVYDTGGLSLKPTPNSMDKMKSDMSGAAVVASVMSILGNLDLPVHVIALIPATDNRPGYEAYTPGDIISMYSGQTVEVLNTDAEGRMILADAIHFAKRYNPMWIADFSTLTGAASSAIGPNAMVAMGNLSQDIINDFINCGYKTNEKIAQMPFWDEYADYIKSPVADMKNIGGVYAGAITAGKFLEKFTDYPYVHFDIAGVSFSDNASDYIPAGGTGTGIRMMSSYFFQLAKK